MSDNPMQSTGAPMFILRDPVIFPYCLSQVLVEGVLHTAALKAAMKGERLIAVYNELPTAEELGRLPAKINIGVFDFEGKRCLGTGVLARVVKEVKLPDGTVNLLVRGVCRIRSQSIESAAGVLFSRFTPAPDAESENEDSENKARTTAIVGVFSELSSMVQAISGEMELAVCNAATPGRTVDIIADALGFSYAEKLIVLSRISIRERLEFMAVILNRELEENKLGMKIQSEVHQAMSRSQREFYLREQLRAVQNELGEDTRSPDIVELDKKLKSLTLPGPVRETAAKEIERMTMIPPSAPEYNISYTYVNWLLDLPWCVETEDRLDCKLAAETLDADHYGLDDVKKRILEFMAVLQLRGPKERRAPILCLVGPPGVGKTSLGKSIARAMNRKFVRISLGGVRDEAEIRGHRRTYIGAMPGRIVQSLKKAGSANPVFMLDEVDKLGADYKGDPASALLEVLDPAQNNAFNDHYIELDCDLSRVFFIATANMLDTIPGPLRDRMEIIRLAGYTALEKREIARRFLAPRQIVENGLTGHDVRFSMAAIDEIIEYYTMEAGVRELERTIARVCRRIARGVIDGEYAGGAPIKVDSALVRKLLGARKFLRENAGLEHRPGCATGMAWTGCGGVTLPVEAVAIPGGKGELVLTGSLGKVMTESAQTAFSLVKSQALTLGIKPDYFKSNDFHIHVPDGATPKDGPSAGVTMTLALISLATGKKLISKLAMTGEITLTGRVTAIGGVREKLTAALRAGIRVVMMPEENRKDADELPEEIRRRLDIRFVRNLCEAMKHGFGEK
ncbi:MAG: endopeptidase La [Victivallaceae bacterium]|nr:endopeptidase La [Victivallaceae bacterium]